ncbi:gliding motility lipoprotein GldB [Aurantibacter sp.]|uniref:gliding motility lipoprotein GldB n=1 Tax=Aurantibacter sp. TaxID=2807103 RepID=UPI0032642DB1
MAIFSCTDENKVNEDIEKIPMDLKIVRFDRELAATTAETFAETKGKYPYLFPAQYTDSIWIEKLDDTIQIELLSEVGKAFPDFDEQKADLDQLYKHIKYYFPRINGPKVLTVTSNVDYRNRIILTDSLLLIGLDNYLGSDHKFYQGMQKYIGAILDKKFMTSDVAGAFATKVLNYPTERTFLSKIIYYGKILYLKDKLLPTITDAQKIGYSQEQYDWAIANEEPMWRYYVENELLYSTDNKLEPRFLDLAPFSKFGLELDNESPSRLGRYIGWQIVKAYMEKDEITPQQLLPLSAEEIFKEANYKPRK